MSRRRSAVNRPTRQVPVAEVKRPLLDPLTDLGEVVDAEYEHIETLPAVYKAQLPRRREEPVSPWHIPEPEPFEIELDETEERPFVPLDTESVAVPGPQPSPAPATDQELDELMSAFGAPEEPSVVSTSEEPSVATATPVRVEEMEEGEPIKAEPVPAPARVEEPEEGEPIKAEPVPAPVRVEEPEEAEPAEQVPAVIGYALRATLTGNDVFTVLGENVLDDVDELDPVVTAMGEAEPSWEAYYQVSLRAAPSGWHAERKKELLQLKAGEPLRPKLFAPGGGTFSALWVRLLLTAALLALAFAGPSVAGWGDLASFTASAGAVYLGAGVLFGFRRLWAATLWAGRVLAFVINGQRKERKQKKEKGKREPLTEEEKQAYAEAERKVGKQSKHFEAGIRLAVFGPPEDKQEMQAFLWGVAHSFTAYQTARQELGWEQEEPLTVLTPGHLPARPSARCVLSAEELGELARFADDNSKPNNVKVDRARQLSLRPQHYIEVLDPLHPDEHLIPVGTIGQGTNLKTIALDNRTLDSHGFIFGKSGSGKSTLLEWVLFAVAKHGYPVLNIDPHGSGAEGQLNFLLRYCPERLDDVVWLDPGDDQHSLALNPLDVNSEADLEGAQGAAMSLLTAEVDWPRAKPLLQAAVVALTEANLALTPENRANLLAIPSFFRDTEYRRLVMEFCKHPDARAAFEPETGYFEMMSEATQSEVVGPIIRKLTELGYSPSFARVFSSPQTKMNVPAMLAQKKVVFLTMGRFGGSRELGEFLASAVLPTVLYGAAVFGRQRNSTTGKYEGIGARVIIDEAPVIFAKEQNAATLQRIFAETRKFDLGLVVAGQTPKQLAQSARDEIFGNTALRIALKSDATVAKPICDSLSTRAATITPTDLGDMDNYAAIGDFTFELDGMRPSSGPFAFATLAPPALDLTPDEVRTREAIIARTRDDYYNNTAKMDARRANGISEMKDELGRLLAQRAGTLGNNGSATSEIIDEPTLNLDEADPDSGGNIWDLDD